MFGKRAYYAIAMVAVVFSTVGLAQKFQEPSKDELQMTVDPKAPGAPAVFLYREEVTDNFTQYVSVYARIKVLTEAGKEWATVEVPYQPGYQGRPMVEARTIHADGSVYPLSISEADLLEGQHRAIRQHKLVFNLPNVTVGSILEYRWTRPMTGTDLHFFESLGEADRKEALASLGSSELASETPQWEVQQKIFIHKEHFYYNPLNDLERNVIGGLVTHYVDGERASYILYTQHLPAGATVGKSPKNDFFLDIQNVPAIQQEMNAPPPQTTQYRVRFYWTPYTTAATYWENEERRWSKDLDQFATPSDALKAAAAQIIADAPTADAKARKLYDAVQTLNNSDFTRARSQAEREQMHLSPLKRAEDVWKEKSGSGNQIAALYLALTRAAGLEAYGLQVADRRWRVFDPNYLSTDQLDSLLVLVRIDGKDIYTDPGQKLCPFGMLQWTHLLAGGLSEATKGPSYTPANLSKDAITAHTADLNLAGDGTMSGTVKLVMSGPAALYWRQLNLVSDEHEVQEQFKESLRGLLPQGVSGELEKFQGLETANGYLSANVKVSGQIGNLTGKHIILPGFFFSTGANSVLVSEEKRELPIDMQYAEQTIDDVIYHIPGGFSVQSSPAATQLPWPEHAAMVIKTQTGSNTIDIKHIFARAFVMLDAKEYPALRDYYQKLAIAAQQPLVLVPEGAAAGN